MPTSKRRLHIAPPDIADTPMLHSMCVKRQNVVDTNLIGDIEDEEGNVMSLGSEEVEDADVRSRGVAPASVTQIDLTLALYIDKYINKDIMELKQRHESASAEVVTLADLLTARHN